MSLGLALGWAVFAGGAGAEEVLHRSGSRWSWPGKEAGDYRRSRTQALLDTTAPAEPGTRGGYAQDMRLLTRLGTYAFPTRPEALSYLLRSLGSSITGGPDLHARLGEVARDEGMFIILERFLRAGGKLSEVTTGGRYTPEPLRIIARLHDDQERPSGKTLFHELLHSYFDRIDSPLWEIKTGGGADHLAIDAFEDRYEIAQAFLFGGDPLHPEIGGLHGFLKAGPLVENLAPLLSDRAPEAVNQAQRLVQSEEFYSRWVQAGMVTPLSSKAYAERSGSSQSAAHLQAWTDERLQDLAFILAWNAQAYALGIHTAAEQARVLRWSVAEAAKTPAAQARYRERLMKWIERLEAYREEGPREAMTNL